MSQAIEMALVRIRYTIPSEILEVTFDSYRRGMAIDHCIYQDVIQSRVLKECNLFAGKWTSIQLFPEDIEQTFTDQSIAYPFNVLSAVYRVPPERRENKSITTAISLDFPTYQTSASVVNSSAGYLGAGLQIPNMTQLACNVLKSSTGMINGISKPMPELLSGDLIRLSMSPSLPLPGFFWVLTCRLEYDSELTNLNHSAVQPFMDLVETATKAYIYNIMILKMDKFYTEGGMELGRYKEIIDSYSDQEEKYREALVQFRGASTALDPLAKAKLIYWSL